MKKRKLKLMFKNLGTSFIKKNFIKNYKSNYEEYLTELINHSKFVSDYGNEKFERIKDQSKGQADIKNSIYELDYKLLIDNQTVRNLKYYSENITIDENGIRTYSASEKEGNWRRYFLTNIMKEFDINDFHRIEKSAPRELNEYEILLRNYLDKLSVDKNILYYLPYNFSFENTKMDEVAFGEIAKIFSKDLRGAIAYRAENTNKDTYLCFLSGENMVFLKYIDEFVLYDVVNVWNSPKFVELEDITKE